MGDSMRCEHKRRLMEQKINRLNNMLRALRAISRLIIRESDPNKLLHEVCVALTGTGQYHQTWIALCDETGRVEAFAFASDLVHSSFMDPVTQIEVPACGKTALSQGGIVMIENLPSKCPDCPIMVDCQGKTAVSTKLEHGRNVHGVLSAVTSSNIKEDEVKQAIFMEVAEEIAFALSHSAGKFAEYSTKLEQMVEERTWELRTAQERLIRNEHLAVIGQLAGCIGHELRDPLTIITNAVYFLQAQLKNPTDTIKENLQIIASEVSNAGKTVSDLLDFARRGSAEKMEISVFEIVSSVLARHPAPSTVKVKVRDNSKPPMVFVDPEQIKHVITNLVVNAYQAMSDGGELTIHAQEKEGQVLLMLSDTGCGISEDEMRKLFEPLFTTKSKGIGLGLAVCKNLVTANGGSIKIESEIGNGCTFTVVLPTKEPTAGYTKTAPEL